MSPSFILRMILPEVLMLLQGFVKNPKSLLAEIDILTSIRDALNLIIEANKPPEPTK